jgi:hypothetical protein
MSKAKPKRPPQWPVVVECRVAVSMLLTAESQAEAIARAQATKPLLFLLGQQHCCPNPVITEVFATEGQPWRKKPRTSRTKARSHEEGSEP